MRLCRKWYSALPVLPYGSGVAVRYDVRCPEHGVQEVERSILLIAEPFRCPLSDCGKAAEQIVCAPIGIRVEDMENAGSERGRDLGHINLGLPGRNVSLGRDASGKEHFAYRPVVSGETSAWRAREICKEHNLTPIEGGRFRTVGQR